MQKCLSLPDVESDLDNFLHKAASIQPRRSVEPRAFLTFLRGALHLTSTMPGFLIYSPGLRVPAVLLPAGFRLARPAGFEAPPEALRVAGPRGAVAGGRARQGRAASEA